MGTTLSPWALPETPPGGREDGEVDDFAFLYVICELGFCFDVRQRRPESRQLCLLSVLVFSIMRSPAHERQRAQLRTAGAPRYGEVEA